MCVCVCRTKQLDREEVVVDETEFFVSAIYIGGVFSTGWSHQPVLKANFGQPKRRETRAFSTGWWLQPVLKGNTLVPVGASNRY